MWAAFTSQVIGLEAACEARAAKQNPTKPISTLERLLTAPSDGVPFNGQGSMRAAFEDSLRGKPSRDDLIGARAEQLKLNLEASSIASAVGRAGSLPDLWQTGWVAETVIKGDPDRFQAVVEGAVQKDLDGEAMALVLWVQGGAGKRRTPGTPSS